MRSEVMFMISTVLLLLVTLAQSVMLAIQDRIVDKLIYTTSNLMKDNIKMHNYINKEANKKNIEHFEKHDKE